MRGSTSLGSRRAWARWFVASLLLPAIVLSAQRAQACGACAVPELWDVQNLGGEPVLVTNFGLLAQHGDGWRVTCEEVFGGLLLSVRGDEREGWVSTDIGPFRRSGSACDWSPVAPPERAVWAWKFALAHGVGEGTTRRFVLVIDKETQELHVERAQGDEDFRIVHSFASTSGFRDLVAGGDPASVFVAGFGAGADRLWQVAFSLDAGDTWQTVVPELPAETRWVLRFVDPLFPRAVFVESEPVSKDGQAVWRFDAESGAMTELVALSEGEELAGFAVLGDTLWIAGSGAAGGSLYRADRNELEFSRVVTDAPPFRCLAAHAGALYACVNDFTYTSAFLLGRSDDEGRTWQPLLTVDDLLRVTGCGSTCDRTLEWLTATFGAGGAGGAEASSTASGEAGAGPEPAEPTSAANGCGCRFGGRAPPSSAASIGAVLGLCALLRRRSRTGKLRLAPPLTVLGAVVLGGCSGDETGPPEAASKCAGRGEDLASLELTSGELLLSVLETWPSPPGVGDNEWLVLLRDLADEPVPGLAASLEVTAFMPEHGHGTPTTVGVTESDTGVYRLAPVNTFMPGVWQIRLAVHRSDDPELFEFRVCVE